MKRLIKSGKILIILIFCALLLILAFWPKSTAVDLARVERGNLTITIDEEGETRVHQRYLVSAPVAGRVERIRLEPGDRVEHGRTVIAVLYPADPVPLDVRSRSEAEANVKAAQAALARLRAEHARHVALARQSRSDLARVQALVDKQVSPRQTLETAETQVRTAEEAVRAAEFSINGAEQEVAAAKARLISLAGPAASQTNPRVIYSPVNGVALKRLRDSEAVVPAGEPLVELGNPEQLEIVVDFLSTDAVKIHPGDQVLIERWGGEVALQGRVRLIEPSGFMKVSALGVEEQRVNVIVDFQDPIEAWKRLGHGYRVEVRVISWQAENILQVPASSLFRSGNDWAVFAASDGFARLRKVEIGRRNGAQAQVLSGLSDNEMVVAYPNETLRDGSRIAARQPE